MVPDSLSLIHNFLLDGFRRYTRTKRLFVGNSRTHKNGRLEHRAERDRERIAVVENEKLAIPVLLKPGECIFFHGDLLHKSKGNSTDRVRRAFFFRYADADAIETLTGEPRIGKLLRGVSRFPEVTNCSDLVCQPAKNDAISAG